MGNRRWQVGGAKLEINGELEVGREEESGELGVESLKLGNKTTPPPQNIFSHTYIHCCPYSHFLMSNLLPPIPCPLPTFHFHLGNPSVQREWDRDNRKNYYRNRVYVLRNKKHLLARPVFCKQSGDYTIMTIIGNSPLRGNLGG